MLDFLHGQFNRFSVLLLALIFTMAGVRSENGEHFEVRLIGFSLFLIVVAITDVWSVVGGAGCDRRNSPREIFTVPSYNPE